MSMDKHFNYGHTPVYSLSEVQLVTLNTLMECGRCREAVSFVETAGKANHWLEERGVQDAEKEMLAEHKDEVDGLVERLDAAAEEMKAERATL